MSVIFLGAAGATIHEVEGAHLSTDKFGFDTLTRRYEGDATKFEAWRKTMPKNKQDRIHKYLHLVKIDGTETKGGVIEISAEFKGTLDAEHKPLRSMGGTLQRATIRSIDGLRTTEIEYYCPKTIIRYISTSQPTKHSFRGVMLQQDLDFQILNRRGSTSDLRVFSDPNNPGVATFGGESALFYVQAQIIPHPISADEVGACWQCEEVNEGRLVDIQLPRSFLRL